MTLTNAERQRLWRERHRDEPRGNKALLHKLAALEMRVAHLAADLAAMPQPAPRKPPGRVLDAVRALKRERNGLAV